MNHMIRLSTLCLAALLTSAAGVWSEDITSFTALEVKGNCKIKTPDADAYSNIETDVKYLFGSTVKTMRKSYVELEFSENNRFRLLARTTLTIEQDTRNPKLKIVKLEAGHIDLQLDDLPADHSLKVETPTAVCGAIGTRFVVAFEDDQDDADAAVAKKGGRENRFSCSDGEVYVASRFSIDKQAVEGDTLDIPGFDAGTEIVAVIHEGKENSYTDIIVNRGKLTFNYGGDNKNTLVVEGKKDKPARFVCALEKAAKKDAKVDMLVLQVKDGVVENRKKKVFGRFEMTAITPDSETVVVKNSKVGKPKDAADNVAGSYIDAARKEGEIHSSLVDLEKEPVPDVNAIAKAKIDLDDAAKEATRLRKLLHKRTRKMMDIQRRAQNRNRPRR